MGNLGVDFVDNKREKGFIWCIAVFKLAVGLRKDFLSRNMAFPITASAENPFQGRRGRRIHPNAFCHAPLPVESNGNDSTGVVLRGKYESSVRKDSTHGMSRISRGGKKSRGKKSWVDMLSCSRRGRLSSNWGGARGKGSGEARKRRRISFLRIYSSRRRRRKDHNKQII